MQLAQLLLGGGILTSCQKDAEQLTNNVKPQASSQNVEQQIIDFKQMVTNTNKSATNQTMQFNDAVWLMEATFNYYHANNLVDYTIVTTDSIYFKTNYNNFDIVKVDEIKQLYKQINNKLAVTYNLSVVKNKAVVLFDFQTQATDDGYEILIIMNIAQNIHKKAGKVSDYSVSEPFGATDYWYAGYIMDNYEPEYMQGKCGDYQGQRRYESDGKNEIEKACRRYLRGEMRLCYFVDVDSYSGRDFPIGTNLYAGYEGMNNECLTPEMMNQYYNTTAQRISELYQILNISSDKQFVDIVLYNAFLVSARDSYYINSKIYEVKFGRKVYKGLPTAIYELTEM